MKKIICLICVIMTIFSLACCDRNDSSDMLNPQESEIEQSFDKKELSDEKLAEIVAKSLGVPDKDGIEYGVSKEMYYFEAADRYYKNITFNENGEMVAAASVDPYNGELLRNIIEYNSPN